METKRVDGLISVVAQRAFLIAELARIHVACMREDYDLKKLDGSLDSDTTWEDYLLNFTGSVEDAISNTFTEEVAEQAKKPAPSVVHVYTDNGSHCIVVNGERGDVTDYAHVAQHPDGYMAITPYYGGDKPLHGDFTAAGLCGMVFRAMPISHQDGNVVPEVVQKSFENRAPGMDGLLEVARIARNCTQAFILKTPYAFDKLPEFQEMLAKHKAEGSHEVDMQAQPSLCKQCDGEMLVAGGAICPRCKGGGIDPESE